MPSQSQSSFLTRLFGDRSNNTILAESILMVLVVGFFDFRLPYEFSMSIFYTFPIVVAAWYSGKQGGDLTALTALIVSWWTDELTMPTEMLGWLHTYRMLVRLFFFLAVSLGASAVKARRDLAAAQIDLLERTHQLESEIIKISEREQQRIGYDLHDGLCQYLAAISCAATSLKNDLQKNPTNDSRQAESAAAAEIAELLKQGVTQARNLARGLSPVHADEAGLDSALQELALYTSRMLNIECEYDPGTLVFVRDNTAAAHLYRIAQEALNNATRHGHATRILITVTEAAGAITLRVTDNGCGLLDSARKPGGMGLKIMDYRARLIGAALSVANNPGASGVTVACTLRQDSAAGAPAPESSPVPAFHTPAHA